MPWKIPFIILFTISYFKHPVAENGEILINPGGQIKII